jgi:hypothetical protein
MIREHQRGAVIMLECTNCQRMWRVRNATPERRRDSSDYHFRTCNTPEPEPLPKQARIYNLPLR